MKTNLFSRLKDREKILLHESSGGPFIDFLIKQYYIMISDLKKHAVEFNSLFNLGNTDHSSIFDIGADQNENSILSKILGGGVLNEINKLLYIYDFVFLKKELKFPE
jgi:hypothetical protein